MVNGKKRLEKERRLCLALVVNCEQRVISRPYGASLDAGKDGRDEDGVGSVMDNLADHGGDLWRSWDEGERRRKKKRAPARDNEIIAGGAIAHPIAPPAPKTGKNT